MTRTVVDFNNNLWWLPCLGAISIIPIPQACPIHPIIYRHPPPPPPRQASTMRLHPASVSSPQPACSPWLYFLLMGLLHISVKLLEQQESTQSEKPSRPIAQRLKTKTLKKREREINPLHSISIPPEPLVLKHYALMLQLWWRSRGGALHSTVTCRSLVICQNLRHWHESMFKIYK